MYTFICIPCEIGLPKIASLQGHAQDKVLLLFWETGLLFIKVWTSQKLCANSPSNFYTFFIIWAEKLKGLVDLQTLPPVIANVKLCHKWQTNKSQTQSLATFFFPPYLKVCCSYLLLARLSSLGSEWASWKCKSSLGQEVPRSQWGSDSLSCILKETKTVYVTSTRFICYIWIININQLGCNLKGAVGKEKKVSATGKSPERRLRFDQYFSRGWGPIRVHSGQTSKRTRDPRSLNQNHTMLRNKGQGKEDKTFIYLNTTLQLLKNTTQCIKTCTTQEPNATWIIIFVLHLRINDVSTSGL